MSENVIGNIPRSILLHYVSIGSPTNTMMFYTFY